MPRPKQPDSYHRESVGKPSEYDPEYCDVLVDKMSQGYSFEACAGFIGVSFQTLYNWAQKYPQFLEAKKEAFAAGRVFWEKLAIDNIINSFQGDTLNASIWIFNMKNRFGWKDKNELELTGSDELTFTNKKYDQT